MAEQILIPKLGMTMTSAVIVEWKAEESEWVEKGSVVLVLETAKVKYDLEADASGFLHINAEKGAEVPVGEAAGFLAETKEELEKLQKEMPKKVFAAKRKAKEVRGLKPARVEGGGTTEVRERKRIFISPLARTMAEDHKIDIALIEGSGPEGRIVRSDIEKAIEERKKAEVTPAEAVCDRYEGRRIKETIALEGMRRAIAEHMYNSISSSAQLTFFGEFEATELVKLRQSLISKEKDIGVRITYTEILVLAIARALKDHPDINCSLIDDEIKVWEDINIGVAVALGKEGLIVPVVKNADQKSLVEISRIVKMLVEKAQAGKLVPDDVTGGTFTLSSIGSVGVSYFQTPILNQPEAAILATGPIVDKPVVRDGEVAVAPMMTYSLTFDHRVINGFGAEVFLARLQELLKTPGLLL